MRPGCFSHQRACADASCHCHQVVRIGSHISEGLPIQQQLAASPGDKAAGPRGCQYTVEVVRMWHRTSSFEKRKKLAGLTLHWPEALRLLRLGMPGTVSHCPCTSIDRSISSADDIKCHMGWFVEAVPGNARY